MKPLKNERDSLVMLAFAMCALGAIFYSYEYYLRVAPTVMVKELQQEFDYSYAGVGLLSSYFYFAYVAMQVPVGVLTDRFGPRLILTLACLSCVIGTYVFANANHFAVSQLGRFLIGFGSAFAYVGVMKIANLWLPKKYFAMMVGLCTLLGMLGAISGEILMASLVENLGWRSTMRYAGFAGIFLTVALWFIIRDDGPMIKESLSLEQKKEHIRVGFWEIIASPMLWAAGIVGCLTFLSITVFAEMWGIPYLEEARGLSKQAAAIGSSMIFLGFGLGGPLWGYWSDYIQSRRLPLVLGSILSAFLSYGILILPSEGVSNAILYIALFFFGFLSSAQVVVFAVGNDICRPAAAGISIAFINMLVMLGGAILQPVFGVLLDYYFGVVPVDASDKAWTFATRDAYSKVLLVLPIGFLLAACLSFFCKESYQK